MTEPTAEQVNAEFEQAHRLCTFCLFDVDGWHGVQCCRIATALARVRIEALTQARDWEASGKCRHCGADGLCWIGLCLACAVRMTDRTFHDVAIDKIARQLGVTEDAIRALRVEGKKMNDEILYMTYTGEVKSVRVNQYPDGMPIVPHALGFRKLHTILLRPLTLQTFVTAMFWVDALVERDNHTLELILPFVPGARQDRLNDTGDYLFTVKSIAKMINDRNFSKVTVIDPHSEVTSALINRCEVIHADACFRNESYAAIISPDAGAEKRAGAIAKKLGIPLFHAWKKRDVSTGKITGFGVEPLPHGIGRVLVVDDICDGGGTFMGLADQLGTVKADLYVTHGLFSQGIAALLSRYGTIYTTDSILRPETPSLTVLPVCERLLLQYKDLS